MVKWPLSSTRPGSRARRGAAGGRRVRGRQRYADARQVGRRLRGRAAELEPPGDGERRLQRQHDVREVAAVDRDLGRRPEPRRGRPAAAAAPGRASVPARGARSTGAPATPTQGLVDQWAHRSRPAGSRDQRVWPGRDVVKLKRPSRSTRAPLPPMPQTSRRVDELHLHAARILAGRIDDHALDASHGHQLQLEVHPQPFVPGIHGDGGGVAGCRRAGVVDRGVARCRLVLPALPLARLRGADPIQQRGSRLLADRATLRRRSRRPLPAGDR